MNTSKVAKNIAKELNLHPAFKYDLHYREIDDMIELIGLVEDPNYDVKDFEGREMLFPKKWVTLDVLDPSYEVTIEKTKE